MYIPDGMTEQQIVDTINRVTDNLAAKFRFGYHMTDDLKQEGALFAIRAINARSYDPSRPLENFLYTHIRNRLINFKRDNYVRNEPPCNKCPFFDPLCKKSKGRCSAFDTPTDCEKLTLWETRNSVKRSLIHPIDVSGIPEGAVEQEDMVADSAINNELMEIINRELPADLRSDFLRIMNGVSVPKARKDKVRFAVAEILKNGGEDV